MTLLYQVDFRTLASQLSLSPGAKTIDGLEWWLKGSLSPGGGRTFAASLVSGSGLRLQHTGGTPVGIGSNADLNEPHWFLPLSQVPGYLATQALLIRGRMVRTVVGTPIIYPLLGLVDTTSDAVGLRAAQRTKDHLVGPDWQSSGGITTLIVKFGASAPQIGRIARAGAIQNNECVPGVLNNHLSGWAVHGSEHQAAAAAIPSTIGTFLPASGSASSTTGDPSFQWTTRSNPGVLFGFLSNEPGWTIDLQWLRVDVLGEVLDATPPTVTWISPALVDGARHMNRRAAVVVRVSDAEALSRTSLWVRYGNGMTEAIYVGGAYQSFFSGTASTIVANKEIEFTFARIGGWPVQSMDFYTEPVDRGGNYA